MASAVKTLSFVSRWDNIPLWGIVLLHTADGTIRAEYVNASERENGTGWEYDFLVHEEDLPGSLTLDDVRNSNIISPFIEEFEPCEAAPSRCFNDLPFVEADAFDEILVPIFDETCGSWCLGRAARPPQYEPGGEFTYTPPEE
jgi:hypothetical protein